MQHPLGALGEPGAFCAASPGGKPAPRRPGTGLGSSGDTRCRSQGSPRRCPLGFGVPAAGAAGSLSWISSPFPAGAAVSQCRAPPCHAHSPQDLGSGTPCGSCVQAGPSASR